MLNVCAEIVRSKYEAKLGHAEYDYGSDSNPIEPFFEPGLVFENCIREFPAEHEVFLCKLIQKTTVAYLPAVAHLPDPTIRPSIRIGIFINFTDPESGIEVAVSVQSAQMLWAHGVVVYVICVFSEVG